MASVPDNTCGFSSIRLKRIESWLEQQVESQRLAGASLCVSRFGKPVLQRAVGELELSSVVRLYSMTKPVTAVAAMMLYEQGCFHLDDPICHYPSGIC